MLLPRLEAVLNKSLPYLPKGGALPLLPTVLDVLGIFRIKYLRTEIKGKGGGLKALRYGYPPCTLSDVKLNCYMKNLQNIWSDSTAKPCHLDLVPDTWQAAQ